MEAILSGILTASFHGSVFILAVLILRLMLKKAPKKFICFLWMLAGLRLLLPIPLQSRFSLQPKSIPMPAAMPIWIPFLWLAVAAVIGAYSLVSYLHLRQKVLDAVKVRGGWESDRIDTAFVLGFLKPKIYIPVGLSPEIKKQILAHERTHLDKGDHWIKLIGFLALALHWFNPLVWISYILLCKDIEMACDERVVQFMEPDERKAYATALLRCSTNQVHYAACPVAFGEVSVKYRIKSALCYKKPGFLLSLLAVLSIAFVAICLFTTPAEQVEIVVDHQEKLAESSRQDPIEFAPAVMPESEPNPDWGLNLIADITSPTGGNIVYVVEDRFAAIAGEMHFSDTYLECWNGSQWEHFAAIQLPFSMMGFPQEEDGQVELWPQEVDWSLTCGSLKDGDYRFVQTVTTGQRSETMRVPFHIYREQLPAEEEDAIFRCKASLEKMISSGYYEVTLFQKDFNGVLSPARSILVSGGKYQVEHYIGKYTSWHATGENAEYDLKNWDMDFRLNQNRKFLFPEGQSLISQEEISFCSVWTDYAGITYRGKDTFCFFSDGNLASVDRIVEVLDSDGDVTEVRQQRMEASKVNWVTGPTVESDYVPEDSHIAQQNSPWGIFFRVDDDYLQPTGGEVWLSTNAVGLSNFTTDGSYWLEKRIHSRWERIGGEEKSGSWGEETISITAQTQVRNVDWTADYGVLEPGVYRMGKRIGNGNDSIICYAEFQILELGGVYGEGGAEALAKVDAAIERLQSSAYRVEQWNGSHNQYEKVESLDAVYWHEGDTQIWDVYNGGQYSHSVPSKSDDELFYGDWLKRSYSNEPYDCMYFADGFSRISDHEITFVQSLSRAAWTDTSRMFTYCFDDNGNLREIVCRYLSSEFSGGYIRYVVTPTSEAEIHSWVTQKQSEQ